MTGPLYERFSTQQGTYVYDTYSNQILSASPATATILDDVLLSRLEPERLAASHADITADNIAAAVKDIEAAVSTGHFGACNVSQMGFYQDDATLLHRIRGAVSHLTLELTERCNFRCRYCPQTYDPARQTSRADMPMRTLRNAVGCFAERSGVAVERTISFWGGEPLVRFDVIQEAIEFVGRDYPKLHPTYSFTTNASLITAPVARFLARHRVQLLVSLDGPREVHDTYRRSRGDAPTFERVITRLRTLRDVDQEYFSKHVRYNCVLTPGTDTRAVFRFFREHELTKGHRVTFNPVSGTGTTFYQQYGQYTPEQTRLLQGDTCDDCDQESRQHSKFKRLLQIAVRPRTPLGATIPVNGCCVPLLKKMLVTVAGDVYMCERSPYDICLGNVNHGGIDDTRVVELVKGYVAQSLPECKTCWAMRLCAACYRDSIRGGRWDPEARAASCSRQRRVLLARLREYTETLERDPAVLDMYKNVTLRLPV
jgi:uncharacterized protein